MGDPPWRILREEPHNPRAQAGTRIVHGGCPMEDPANLELRIVRRFARIVDPLQS